ncbi:MAG: proline--tRNA ligase [Candidatus Binatia bacterium]
MEQGKITPRAEDYSQWYQDVVREGDLAQPAEVVKGCMVIKPHGYAIWEKIQRDLDRRFKATGHKNAYFPLLVPMSFIQREAEHVEGFAPELAVVTHAGGKELEEPYAIRPTSETIIGHFFAQWVQSWRDLPLLINQWANVMRWELRTRMFLRTGEFLWQEGHTAHATHEEALEETMRMLDVYADFAEDVMAMPVVKGRKTDWERFAGAVSTFTIEAMMQDGKALQAGTSHDLGQNFGKAFGVKFQSKDGQEEFVWQTSWGVSTRLVGALIMTHSDDNGLVLPPKLAPIHVVIVPIYKTDDERARTLAAADAVAAQLKPVRYFDDAVAVEVDRREGLSPGAKYYHWERRGVPLRLEIGPKDLEKSQVAIKRRDGGPKTFTPMAGVAAEIPGMLDAFQDALRAKACAFRDAQSAQVDTWDELVAALDAQKFVYARWAGDPAFALKLKELQATVRCIPLGAQTDPGPCVLTGQPAETRVLVARNY